jgi:hypothetical protein
VLGGVARNRGRGKSKPLILLSLLLAAFVINLDTTIVNVASPTLVGELHASTSQLQWVVDAYSLVFAAAALLPAQPLRRGTDAPVGPVPATPAKEVRVILPRSWSDRALASGHYPGLMRGLDCRWSC